jgi:tRNA threonylcarbamoyladenosine biosynthesis protein TsaE
MATCISHSPEETAALGEAWGHEAEGGWVIGLSGDLGAGKTQLVKGLARGLGVAERVRSPTFALVSIYESGRLPLFHLDLYRLETPEQIMAAGLEEYLQPAGVAVIEWAERWFGGVALESTVHSPQSAVRSQRSTLHAPRSTLQTLPSRLRLVQIAVLNETERRITYEDSGD